MGNTRAAAKGRPRGSPEGESKGSGVAGSPCVCREKSHSELESALHELPDEQREVFVAHEFEGRSFKELSEESGVGVNTLLSRKRYAIRHLRERLRSIHDEFSEPMQRK